MTSTTLALIVVAVGVVAFLVLVGLGATRLIGRSKALRQRLEGYGALPIVKMAATTEARVSATQRTVGTLPQQRLRAVVAVTEIRSAFDRIAMIVKTVRIFVRNMLGAT